jgi:hypothetical protein
MNRIEIASSLRTIEEPYGSYFPVSIPSGRVIRSKDIINTSIDQFLINRNRLVSYLSKFT